MRESATSNLPKDVRTLLAKREEMAAKLNVAESEVARMKSDLSQVKAELLRSDALSFMSVREVMRW